MSNLVFNNEQIKDIAGNSINGIAKEYRLELTDKTKAWADKNVHRFLEIDDEKVYFDKLGFDYALISACQDIAAIEHYPTV